ncbi:MAG: hypothetical protein ABFC67_10490 [Mizugakiibacter sp.]|uniref:hypothetical protein n=1 Tax=Mizugakiibacter sp. TaxID=1972610 RepID=UPI0031C96D05|nr:hypothetical protein [Xanthomonadaceae bacterium]
MHTRDFRRLVPWLLVVAPAALAMVLRYALIEPADVAHRCDAGTGPWWCSLRHAAVLAFTRGPDTWWSGAPGVSALGWIGTAALLAAALALLRRRTATATLAAALGAVALVLYCFQSGALALLVGALALARTQARTPPEAGKAAG